LQTPTWEESDTCQQCNKPFFWNFRMMFDLKTVGMRQHHCRRCGKAVCEACSPNKLTIPIMGFESAVRVCSICHSLLKDQDRPSHVVLINAMHSITAMDLDETKKRMITVGQDRVVKVIFFSPLVDKSLSCRIFSDLGCTGTIFFEERIEHYLLLPYYWVEKK
jgi:FYVE zinc finger